MVKLLNISERAEQENWSEADWWTFFHFIICFSSGCIVPRPWVHAPGEGGWLALRPPHPCYRRPGQETQSWRRCSPSPWTWAFPRTPAAPPSPTSPSSRSCSRCGWLSPTPGNTRVSQDKMSLMPSNFQGGGEEEEENQPLDLSWPDTCRERITYLAFLPIIIPLWLTLPDTRKESG